jgi:lipopolysaccharide transport system permease protein
VRFASDILDGYTADGVNARYHQLEAIVDERRHAIRVRFRLENRSNVEWSAGAGYHLGWQVYDPVTATFITEGEWAPFDVEAPPGETRDFELHVTLPPQNGPYRVFVSPVHELYGWFYPKGGQFVLIDAAVSDGGLQLSDARVTTVKSVRRRNLVHNIPKIFTYPVESLWRNRMLIRSMARRDILARYRGSFGDVLWTVLNPLLLMSTYFFVFGIVLRARFGADQSKTGFALYFLAGMLPWLAFSEPVGRAPYVVLEHRNFVKKLVFPLETLPVTQVMSGFVTEMFALAVFVIFVAAAHGLPATALWLPALIIPQILFTLGVCWFLAALGAYVRDLGQIMGFILTLWFFLTPICYPETHLPQAALWILAKNPLFVLVREYRGIFLDGRAPEFGPLWKLWVLGTLVCVLGYGWFHKLRRSFADVI